MTKATDEFQVIHVQSVSVQEAAMSQNLLVCPVLLCKRAPPFGQFRLGQPHCDNTWCHVSEYDVYQYDVFILNANMMSINFN